MYYLSMKYYFQQNISFVESQKCLLCSASFLKKYVLTHVNELAKFRFRFFSDFSLFYTIYKNYNFINIYRNCINQKEKRNIATNSQTKMCSVNKVAEAFASICHWHVQTIAHFRVALSLSIKARPGAQPFI